MEGEAFGSAEGWQSFQPREVFYTRTMPGTNLLGAKAQLSRGPLAPGKDLPSVRNDGRVMRSTCNAHDGLQQNRHQLGGTGKIRA